MAKAYGPLKDAAGEPAAGVSIRIGEKIAFDAQITNAGLLSVATLMTGILLSSAVIVAAAALKKKAGRPVAPSAGPILIDRS
jgi:hypothetical protein